MSSTNHTTNYNLPQFVGSDKPAWLGDVNPALAAIDTAMHANNVKAQQGIDDAATAKTRADNAYTLADSANTNAGTAQGTANQAIANASAVNAALVAFEQKFNLTDISTGAPSYQSGTHAYCTFTLAQNSEGSIYKFYGNVLWNSGTVIKNNVAVPGLTGYYGSPTGLYLNQAPDSAYFVDACGIMLDIANNETSVHAGTVNRGFAVGSDAQIYAFARQSSANITISSGEKTVAEFTPCIYFNGSFGDTPAPEE